MKENCQMFSKENKTLAATSSIHNYPNNTTVQILSPNPPIIANPHPAYVITSNTSCNITHNLSPGQQASGYINYSRIEQEVKRQAVESSRGSQRIPLESFTYFNDYPSVSIPVQISDYEELDFPDGKWKILQLLFY